MSGQASRGIDGNTPWIWLHLFVPILAIIPMFFVDWRGLVTFDVDAPSTIISAQLAVFLSPAYLVSMVASLLAYGVSVVFAAVDHRELSRRGVSRPFPWAFAFLGNFVYLIGRSVVVVRRTGRGWAPLWAAGAVFLVSIVGSVWFTIWLTLLILEEAPGFSR
jgi:hypothetical protein